MILDYLLPMANMVMAQARPVTSKRTWRVWPFRKPVLPPIPIPVVRYHIWCNHGFGLEYLLDIGTQHDTAIECLKRLKKNGIKAEIRFSLDD